MLRLHKRGLPRRPLLHRSSKPAATRQDHPNGVTMLERAPRLPPPPRAERRPKVSTWHGTRLVDDYAWLRAENWQEVMRNPSALDPRIRAYLTQENEYTKAALAHTEALQQTLFAEMKGRIKEDDSTVPSPDGPMAYYIRYR